MNQIEVVIDGTNCGGKTPLVNELLLVLNKKYTYATCAPYKSAPFSPEEVFEYWSEKPGLIAEKVISIMKEFRNTNIDKDIIIWDRGWPTAFTLTDLEEVKKLYYPLPDITILLINTIETLNEKIKKYNLSEKWHTDDEFKKELNTAYRNLNKLDDAKNTWLKVYIANEEGRFNLKELSEEIIEMINILKTSNTKHME